MSVEKKERISGDNHPWPKGLWIPGEVLYNTELSYMEKHLFCWIQMLDNDGGCFASNEYLASLLDIKNPISISQAVSRLKDLGYIHQTSFDGRKRVLKIDPEYISKYRQTLLNHKRRVYLKVNENNIRGYKKEETTAKAVVTEPDGSVNNDASKKKTKPIQWRQGVHEPYVPAWLEEILSIWNGSGLHPHTNRKAKYFKESVLAMKELRLGRFFNDAEVFYQYKRKFTQEEILASVRNFALAAVNPDYEPTSLNYKKRLRKTYIKDFLYDPFAKGEKSLFLKYLEQRPRLAKDSVKPIKDDNPKVTQAIRTAYIEVVLGGLGPNGRGFGQQVENKFIQASSKLINFFRSNKRRINPIYVRTTKDQAALLVDSLVDKWENVEPGNLCSDNTFNKILPAYLVKQRVMD